MIWCWILRTDVLLHLKKSFREADKKAPIAKREKYWNLIAINIQIESEQKLRVAPAVLEKKFNWVPVLGKLIDEIEEFYLFPFKGVNGIKKSIRKLLMLL